MKRLFILLLFVVPVFAQGQTPIVSIPAENAIRLDVSPGIPGPGEIATISLEAETGEGRTVDKGRWTVNGKEVPAAKDNSIQVKVGKLGTPTVIRYSGITGLGNTMSEELTLYPLIFDVMWEGLGYTFPGYKGKSVAGAQIPIHIVSFVRYIDGAGVLYTEDDFLFAWERDSVPIEGGVRGNSEIIIDGLGVLQFETRVTSNLTFKDYSFTAAKQTIIPMITQKAVLYERSPLYGLFTNTTIHRNSRLIQPEIELHAIPLFFPRDQISIDSLAWSWSLDGEELDFLDDERSIPVSKIEGLSDLSIEVEIKNKDDSLFLQESKQYARLQL